MLLLPPRILGLPPFLAVVVLALTQFGQEKHLLIFQLVCSYHAGKTQYSTALKICNQSKNRSADLLPTDSHRVFLSPGSECEGSDYINASWLTGSITFSRDEIFHFVLPIQSNPRFLQSERLHRESAPSGGDGVRAVADGGGAGGASHRGPVPAGQRGVLDLLALLPRQPDDVGRRLQPVHGQPRHAGRISAEDHQATAGGD